MYWKKKLDHSPVIINHLRSSVMSRMDKSFKDYEPAIMKMKEGDETAFQNILSNPGGMATSDLMTYAFLNREGNERVGITQDFTRALKVFEKVAKQGMWKKKHQKV